MSFTLQGIGPFLHWMTLGILLAAPFLLAFVIYKLGSLPGSIARARGHPQADAINICGWMGIITLVLWPVAMVWAHLTPPKPVARQPLSDADREALVRMLRQTSQRIAGLEHWLSHGTRNPESAQQRANGG